MTAPVAAAALAEGVRASGIEVVHTVPMADGGEGTLDALLAAGGQEHTARVRGPLHDPVTARWVSLGGRAYLEAAQANGLALVAAAGTRSALAACTCGVGDLIKAALDAGHRDVAVTVGGSAATDGGAGLLRTLGARITSADGGEVGCGGGALTSVASVSLAGLDPRLRNLALQVATDVDNPLVGEQGSAAVYAPQKGADGPTVEFLVAGLRQWAAVLDAAGHPIAHRPGGGAAGGTAAALMVLGADVVTGARLVMDASGLLPLLASVDVVITGEGSLDAQSLRGKVVAAVAAAAPCPVYAVAGRIELSAQALADAGISRSLALVDLAPSVRSAMDDAPRWAAHAARLLTS